ncbi:MBL fold metallo-hydrolase [Desnuesiella massiliensis]|uniref:MBL fold metallo-hydrolase n=1 Tax=Desnuesiella massiliensis TaxID=1650662 RepID=UPI0006E2F1B8|nr:MBL fold metallo-hydrolase [Desnuesiella massiliensis]
MELKRIPAGVYAANCYIVMDEETKEALIMDPGGDEEDIIEAADNLGARVKYIVLTHGHIDHTGAVITLKKRYNVPVYIHAKDEELILKRTFMFGVLDSSKGADGNLKDGDILTLGNMEVKCIETPGHTPGGVCFLVENNLFTGDTLFSGSIGRTDLTGGDFETIIRSIKEKLMVLDSGVVVYPGHGPSSTIGREKQSNPFL